MENEQKASENQESSEKLIAGKYKSQEELVKAAKESEKRVLELQESLDREQRVNILLAQEPKAEPKPVEESRPIPSNLASVIGDEAAAAVSDYVSLERKRILEEAENKIQNVVSTSETARTFTDRFYTKYEKLRGFEDEVDNASRSLQSDLGARIQGMKPEVLMAEVAKRAKEIISENRKKYTSEKVLHVASGETKEPQIEAKDAPTSPKTEEERTRAYFEEELKSQNDKRSKPLRG